MAANEETFCAHKNHPVRSQSCPISTPKRTNFRPTTPKNHPIQHKNHLACHKNHLYPQGLPLIFNEFSLPVGLEVGSFYFYEIPTNSDASAQICVVQQD
jgi:hypothetical protein